LHGFFSAQVRAFAEDRNAHSSRFYRFINEAPTVIMILAVFLVVMKP
jgi:putative membrane protein